MYTARLNALNVETEQCLESKRVDLLWDEEENGNLRIQIETKSLELEEGLGVDEAGDEVGGPNEF